MNRSILLLIFSVALYGSTLWYQHNHTFSGTYESELSYNSSNAGQWRERVNLSINDQMIQSKLYLEGEGTKGVALFQCNVKVDHFSQNSYEYTAQLSSVHEAEITSIDLAQYYADILFKTVEEQRGKFSIIYYDEDLLMVDFKRKNHVSLFVRSSGGRS